MKERDRKAKEFARNAEEVANELNDLFLVYIKKFENTCSGDLNRVKALTVSMSTAWSYFASKLSLTMLIDGCEDKEIMKAIDFMFDAYSANIDIFRGVVIKTYKEQKKLKEQKEQNDKRSG